MYATIRRYQGKPGQTEEVIRRVQSGLVPILTKQPGFVAYHAVDAGNNVAISVSLFDTRAHADAATAQALSWVKANLANLVGPAEITAGDVVVSATAAHV